MDGGNDSNLFSLRLLALAPSLRELTENDSAELLRAVANLNTEAFLKFLFFNRLDQHWRHFLTKSSPPEELSEWLPILREQGLHQAARQLKQRHTIEAVHRIFSEQEIPYFVFKGAHLRHVVYNDPLLRSSSDIDVFVPSSCKFHAVRALTKNGFSLHAEADNISHEVTLMRNKVAVDLHWQLLRPARLRIDLTEFFMNSREPFGEGWWGLDRRASLLVMLVHPAVTKYLLSPVSMLAHMVDVHRLLDGLSRKNWEEVMSQLQGAGARTAAWATLSTLALLGGGELPKNMATEIQPGQLRRRYLHWWIERDLIYHLFKQRWLVKGLFSLILQDSPSDVLRLMQNSLIVENPDTQRSELANFLKVTESVSAAGEKEEIQPYN